MAENVQFILDADEAKAVKSFLKVVDAQKQSERQFSKSTKQGQRFGKSLDMAKRAAGALSGALLGAGGLAAGLKLITDEYSNIVQLQERASKQQISFASSVRDLKRNLPGVSAADQRALIESGVKISRDTSVESRFILSALADAVSATGGDRDLSAKLVRTSARFLADKPSEIGGFAGSLGDLVPVTGSRDPMANLGFLQFVAGQSRVVSPQQQAKNIPRALIGLRRFGFGNAGAAALFSSLTTGAGDITGESSGTAGIQLAEQLRGFFRGVRDVDLQEARRKPESRRSELERVLLDRPELVERVRGTDQFTGTQRLQMLQGDRGLAQAFLADASFEKKFVGPIEALLLDQESKIATQFRQIRQQVPEDPARLSATGRESLTRLESGVAEQIGATHRLLNTLQDQLLAGRPRAALAGTIRKEFKGVLQAAGESAFLTRIRQGEFELESQIGTTDPAESAIGILSDLAERRRKEAGALTGKFRVAGPGVGRWFNTRKQAEAFARENLSQYDIGGMDVPLSVLNKASVFKADRRGAVSDDDRREAARLLERVQVLEESIAKFEQVADKLDQAAQKQLDAANTQQNRPRPPQAPSE